MKLAEIISLVEDARKAATMENASFDPFDTHVRRVSASGAILDDAPIKGDAYIKAHTKLYRESWIIPQLDAALRQLREEKDKRRKKR